MKKCVVAFVAVLLVLLSGAFAVAFTGVNGLRMIAHRGFSGYYPQNTQIAFEKAGENLFCGAETDVRRTKDGVFVLSHDNDVNFADGTTLNVDECDFAELVKKPLENVLTDDEVFLCTLEEYFGIMKKYNMECFVELKGEYDDDELKELVALAEKVYSLDYVVVQSFDFDNLVRMREMFPTLQLMLTYGMGDSGYERCFEYGISIDANIDMLNKSLIEDFHEHNLLVAGYSANGLKSLVKAKLTDMLYDIDYLESDYYPTARLTSHWF